MSDTPVEEIKDETEDVVVEAEALDAAHDTIEETEIIDGEAAEADEDEADEDETDEDEDEDDEDVSSEATS